MTFHALRLVAISAVVLGLSACPKNQGRFVKPVATPVTQEAPQTAASKYEDGYLRVFVSSNLDVNGRAIDFGKDEALRPAMLLISAKFGKGTVASFASDSSPEIPVLLYDVQSGKTVSSVVDNALLGEGLLIDPESLSKSPHLQIVVRGVPADKARWVTNLLELATAEPMLKFGMGFVPGGQVVTGLSSRLGELLSDEIRTEKKPWEEKTLLGLRTDEGLAELDGRQFVVLLNSSTIELEKPAPDLRPCKRSDSPSGLCNAEGQPWKPAQAYVRFELDVTDYRSVKDFIGSAVSCEADERVWADYRALLASGQLARKQTEYERHLLNRGELLLRVRRSQNETPPWQKTGRLLQFAQQAALLPVPDDAYWHEHYDQRAKQTDACIRKNAIDGQSQHAAIWDQATQLFARASAYPVWAKALNGSADPDGPALRDAERELAQLHQLLAVHDLQALDKANLDSLYSLDSQLQQMLRPAYARIIERILEDSDTKQSQRLRLTDLIARSACSSCRELLAAKADTLIEVEPEVVALPDDEGDTTESAAETLEAAEAPPEPATEAAPASAPAVAGEEIQLPAPAKDVAAPAMPEKRPAKSGKVSKSEKKVSQ